MILRAYCILDKAIQAFNAPMLFRSEGEALRSFMEAVGTAGSQIAKHKQDYTFCYCGTWNDSTGLFTSEPPIPVAEAATVLNIIDP